MGTHLAVSLVAASAAMPSPTPFWFTLATFILGSSVVAALGNNVVSSLRAAAEVRREGYAETSRALISRVEFPYRIRRRTSDSPEVLADLSRIGSDIQERLAAQRTWVAGESRAMAAFLDQVCAAIDEHIRAASADAWSHPAITAPEHMILGDWGPGAAAATPLGQFRHAASFRFGLRRLVPAFVWRRWVTRRMKHTKTSAEGVPANRERLARRARPASAGAAATRTTTPDARS
jgi:hypothetical protein